MKAESEGTGQESDATWNYAGGISSDGQCFRKIRSRAGKEEMNTRVGSQTRGEQEGNIGVFSWGTDPVGAR